MAMSGNRHRANWLREEAQSVLHFDLNVRLILVGNDLMIDQLLQVVGVRVKSCITEDLRRREDLRNG